MAQKKILLVDDSETILQLEQMILGKYPFDIATARDGKEGVAMALRFKPDLILLDAIMPAMNGFEALRRLRQHDETKSVPVVMVTTEGEAASMEQSYLGGCNDYIVKPLDAGELIAKVTNLLGE